MTSKTWWKLVKPHVRQIEQDDGVLIVDDSIMEKPYTDENEIICWHNDHAKGKTIKGINLVSALYVAQEVALPAALNWLPKRKSTSIRILAKKSARDR